MLTKTLQVLVHSERDTLWALMIDKLQHPGRYLPGITESRIIEKTETVTVREMRVHGETVRERVYINSTDSELRHELIDHPQFTGVIIAKIVRSARQSPVAPQYLEYDLELQPKSFKTEGIVRGEEEIVADLETEMHRLKARAEVMESLA